MSMTESTPPSVAQLADEFARRFRNGERPSLTEYTTRYPEHADELRELFPALVALEQFGPGDAGTGDASPSLVSAGDQGCLSQLGDFRIIREVGRGGMGVVYEAEQVSLSRRVALKVLPKQALLDSKHRQRFEREARAAARLHHTNIVPVFGVGQQDGLHYYVMQFIHGLGLDEVLVELKRLRVEGQESRVKGQTADVGVQASACVGQPEGWTPTRKDVSANGVAQSLLSGHFERTVVVPSDSAGADQPSPFTLDSGPSTLDPTTAVGRLSDTFPLPGHSEHSSKAHTRTVYWQSVTRIGVQAAEALQYAHDQGIIHRDVKPGNLLLDTRGCVWVTDFGLAKAADQKDLTHTGDVLGTLRYMAPEQFDGRADARSDVYSLGLTLYELLSLQPAFDETERHKLVKQVTTGTPARLRTIDRHVPRDLETIVHKALDREPAHRYQTAGELADDLRRYLGDEPIHARRPPLLQRLAKWGRRHRAVIATASLCLLVGTALLAGTIGWAVRDRAAREAGVVRDRLERQAHLTAQVDSILDDVERLQHDGNWADALAAATRAESVLSSGEADPAVEERARQAVMELEMVRRLEQVWMERATLQDGNFDHAGTVEAYAQAFRQFGVDIQSLPTNEAVVRLAAHRGIALPLAAALDQWADAHRHAGGDESGVQSLASVARELDPDPLRNRLRTLRSRPLTPDVQAELRTLVEGLDVRRQAPATLDWLATTLSSARLDELQEQVLRQAQQAHPGDVWVNMQLGNILRKQNNHDDRIRFFSAAVAARPTFPAAHTNLGNALADRGLTDEAITAYREAVRLQPGFAVAHANLGKALSDKGLTEEAIAACREAIRHKPDYAPAHINLGSALADKGLTEEAIAAFREAVRLEPDYSKARYNLGRALSDKGLTDEAIAAYRESVRLQPDFAAAHSNLGNALSKKGLTEEAIAAYREAIRLQPDCAAAHDHLGALLCDVKRDYDGAVAAFREAIRLQPEHANAHTNLGNALSGMGLTDEAIAAYREAIRLQPDFAAAHHNLGVALSAKGLKAEAIAAYREAIRLNPDDANVRYSLGHALSKMDLTDEAIAAYREAIRLQPDFAAAHIGLGALLCDFKRDYDGAIAAFREAIRLNPDFAVAHSNLGQALSKKGLTDEAIAAYREAICLQPDYALAHDNLGVALGRMGLTEEAIAAYTNAIECNPRFASPRNNLAWLLANCMDPQFRNPDRAVELGKRAVELSPSDGYFWNTLGVAHYRAAEWPSAIEALQKSMELRAGGDGFDWFFLSTAHWQLGNKDEARKWYDKAVAWTDQNRPADEELRRFLAEAEELLGQKPEEGFDGGRGINSGANGLIGGEM